MMATIKINHQNRRDGMVEVFGTAWMRRGDWAGCCSEGGKGSYEGTSVGISPQSKYRMKG